MDHPSEEIPPESRRSSQLEKAGIPDTATHDESPTYPPLRTVALVMTALYLAMFLVSLDRIIISTAVPRITDAFHSLQDVGWYGSAYVLASCATQLLFGRIFALYDRKAVFVAAVVLFEAGSALCGAAPSSGAFIAGRALAGAGSAGVFAGVIVIMVPLVPLAKRPMYQGLLGAIFGVSSVVGPLVGGAFTNNARLTWRWCFYVNLPIGAVSVALILLFLDLPPPPLAAARGRPSLTALDKLRRIDPLGTLLFAPSIVSLLLALQWGGTTYAWNSARVIALLVVFGVLFVAWVAVQARGGDNATVPPRIFLQRSIVAGMAFSTCVGGIMLVLGYYIAIWFQAVDGVDALQSGIRTLPFILALVAAAIVSGAGVSRIGYYAPFVVAGACLAATGTGLLTTLAPDSGEPQWAGYQFLAGFGVGLAMQMPGLAAQVVLSAEDVPVGASLMFFGQSLGGAVFVCAAQNVFLRALSRGLSAAGLSAAAAEVLAGVGATDLRGAVPPALLPAVLAAYNAAVTKAFFVAVGLACFSVVPALAFEWRSVKKGKGGKEKEKERDVEGAAVTAEAGRGR